MAFILSLNLNFPFKVKPVNIIQMIFMRWQMIQLPFFALVNQERFGNKLLLHILPLAVEKEIFHTSFNIQIPGFAIQIQTQPVIHFEGKNIWGGADLENKVVYS